MLESHLPAEISAGPSATGVAGGGLALEAVERAHIAEMLAQHGGNRTRTARSLGISRATLYAKLARYGLGEIGWSRPIRPSDPSK